ncbi:hypothetical protein H4219_004121 [Mycoemilia scoparia]|uniref:Uncharacterized protein n=1 Tax=Mycoemilia scoparia TaxID=417184 RepID=A0A9W7ZTI6_9FUNG|nr:hypothetical protein H4219_004121 [Mycoemilia scoparia]
MSFLHSLVSPCFSKKPAIPYYQANVFFCRFTTSILTMKGSSRSKNAQSHIESHPYEELASNLENIPNDPPQQDYLKNQPMKGGKGSLQEQQQQQSSKKMGSGGNQQQRSSKKGGRN